MKIIQITAAYKPAYIYGGPTMSVAKLCEALSGVELGSCGEVERDQVEALRCQEVEKHNRIDVEVFTTTANGQTELAVVPGETQIVDGVRVTYFKRLTKDHTHFSPALLRGLRKVLRQAQHDNRLNKKITNEQRLSSVEQRTANREQRTENREQPTTTSEQRTIKPPRQRRAATPPKEGNNLIIHIHAWWNLVSIFSCWLAKFYNVPVVLSPRGMLTDYTLGNRNVGFKSIIHSLVGKTLLSYCHIHATSEKEKEDILKFINPKSITVIPNLVELEAKRLKVQTCLSAGRDQGYLLDVLKRPVLPSLQGEGLGVRSKDQSLTQQLPDLTTQPTFKLIFLSRIEEKKGLELLFEALAKFDVDWSLTIAGSGEEEYIESLKTKAERLKLNHISWIGQVKNEDKFNLLAEHDLMVLTSHNENFANVVIESLSVGTPVLLSNEVGLANYVQEKDLGWVTKLNIVDITNMLNQSYTDFTKRQHIRDEAPELILADFNDTTLLKKYINLYGQII